MNLFLLALVNADVDLMVRAMVDTFPGAPLPETREQAEFVLHNARTQTASLDPARRIYSHRWLCERALPSALPDALRSISERGESVIMSAVGIVVESSNPERAEEAIALRTAMAEKVAEMYADGDTSPEHIQAGLDGVKTRFAVH